MSYILDALKKLEHERKRREATPELLICVDNESRAGYRHILKYLLVSSVIVNVGLLFWWLGFQKPVKSDEKMPLIPTRNHLQATVVLSPKPATGKFLNHNPGIVSPTVNEAGPPEAVTKPNRLKAPGAEKKNANKDAVITVVRDEPAEDMHVSGSQPRILRRDERAQASPNVRVWEDEHGNVHFSGTAGGN